MEKYFTNEIIEKEYNELLRKVETNKYYTEINLTNRTNCYVCHNCFHITKTRDIDKGVTPFMFKCEKCGEFARSVHYLKMLPNKKPTIEWYRPSLEECLKMWDDPSTLEYVLNGGLLSRKIKS